MCKMLASWLGAFLVLTSSSAHAGAPQSNGVNSAFPLIKHVVRDKFGQSVTYYINEPANPAPILLMIQGSGCGAVIHGEGATSYSTLFDLLPFAAERRFAVVVVEKPFADAASGSGTAESCSADFNRYFTAEHWLASLQAALTDASRQPNVDTHKVMVLGGSEGAVMAALLAGRDARVTDVVGIGGSGTTQLFDFIASAYERCFDKSACIVGVEKQVAAIRADPKSATSFVWGHPHRRWTSFFAVDPGQELVRSHARVYLAFGTADRSTPALSQEVAVAKLLAAGRDVTVRRVLDADHSLMVQGEGIQALDREYRHALDWFFAGQGSELKAQAR